MNSAAPDHRERIPLYHNDRFGIDADAEQLGMRRHDRLQVMFAMRFETMYGSPDRIERRRRTASLEKPRQAGRYHTATFDREVCHYAYSERIRKTSPWSS